MENIIENQDINTLEYADEVVRVLQALPEAFPMALDYLLNLKRDKEKLTEEVIAERADLDVRTIQRLRTDDGQNPTKL